MAETKKIIISLNPDSILYIQTTWLSILSLVQCIHSQTFRSTNDITAIFSNNLPIHDHVAYFSHLCYIKVWQ